MSAPRLEIDLDKIYHNACTLVERLSDRGISVTGITKAVLGSPEIAVTMLEAGVSGLGDSRIENIESMRHTNVAASITLIRSPMLSQVDQVIKYADVSFNTELEVIKKLSLVSRKAERMHGVVLMVELGDLREGIMPDDVIDTVQKVLSYPNILLKGIGTNLACRSGVSPDVANMAQLSALADLIEDRFDLTLEMISGGNSANLLWALSDADMGRVNDLRLGEAILLGCEPLHRQAINGLYTDAFTLVAEVIESKVKPSQPTGIIAQTALGGKPSPVINRGYITQEILAIGQQDIDPHGLCSPGGMEIHGASSDHLILESHDKGHGVGTELKFQLTYSALVRAMTSPYVAKAVKQRASATHSSY